MKVLLKNLGESPFGKKNNADRGNITSLRKSRLSIMTLTALSLLSILSGCGMDELSSDINTSETPKYELPGVYPKAQTATRSSESGFWESWDYITLSNGQKVNTPWNKTSTISSVPHDILEDIKYNDGWDLIFYQLDDIESNGNYTGNNPHLIFHNRYTGILKGFCYMSSESFSPNNHGIWEIKTDGSTSLFAFQNNPITTISQKENKIHNVSNITDNSSCGFSIGWNCFQIELAYDPSQSGWISISTVASNTVKLSFTGNLEAETKGLITTSTGSNNFGSGIAKIAGDEAGTWISKKINDKTILGIPSSIISAGVKDIVSGGVGSIIGALTGLFKSDNSSKSLQLTTNGTFSIQGEANFVSTTGIPNIQFNIDPKLVGYLGVWGLQKEPTLLFSPYATLKSPQQYTNGYTREYRVDIANSNVNASVLYNPGLSKFVKSRNITTEYYQTNHITRSNIWGTSGSLGRDPLRSNRVYENLYQANLYMIADVAFLGDENAYIPANQVDAPMEVFIPNVPNGPKGAIPNFRYNSYYLASVGIKLTLNDGSEAYSYHQCVPYIDWNISEYNNGLYWYLYPCEPVARLNARGLNIQPLDGLEILPVNDSDKQFNALEK
ncbi:MAG: hypothetical protein K2J49_06355 [Muribaculaceae bacterium]|nr:hypothetical protein [Muribaculaceae bacterium]